MTKDDILSMAKEAGIDDWWESGGNWRSVLDGHLERFAALIAEKERDACAKVCYDVGLFHEVSQGSDLAFELAEAIRARGNE